jgi:hypothetical protein
MSLSSWILMLLSPYIRVLITAEGVHSLVLWNIYYKSHRYSRFKPLAEAAPGSPLLPSLPGSPGKPIGPVSPLSPRGPGKPRGPTRPGTPVEPGGPDSPYKSNNRDCKSNLYLHKTLYTSVQTDHKRQFYSALLYTTGQQLHENTKLYYAHSTTCPFFSNYAPKWWCLNPSMCLKFWILLHMKLIL